MTEYTLQALHDEIENDPEALGYKDAGVWKGDGEIADLLNANNYTIDRVSVEMETVRAATAYDAYNTLLADEQEWLTWMTPNNGNFLVTSDMKLQLSGRTLATNGVAGTGDDNDSFWVLAQSSTMAPIMLALIQIPGSRAEVLWDENSRISAGMVGAAANL